MTTQHGLDAEALLVREYALVLCDVAADTKLQLDAAVDGLLAAREAADVALERCRLACELAERWAAFAARAADGDADPGALKLAAESIAMLLHTDARP